MKDISLNFGAIKESILRLGSRDFFNGERKTLDSFFKVVKENATLNKQQLIFKSFDTDKQFKKERLAERYINQTLDILSNVSWDSIIKENRSIRIGYLDNSHVGSTSSNDKLYNAIHTLMECKCLGPGNYNISNEQEAYELVMEHLMSEKKSGQITESVDEPDLSWEYVTKLAFGSFNKRYSHLSESEQRLIKVLTSSNEIKSAYLTNLKNESLDKIKKLKAKEEDAEAIKLLSLYENKMNNLNIESIKDIDEAIIACEDLKENLK